MFYRRLYRRRLFPLYFSPFSASFCSLALLLFSSDIAAMCTLSVCYPTPGFAQDGSICVRLNGTCTMEKCPLPRLEYRPSTQSVILVNSCYEWQYPECNGDEIVGCNDCMGVSSSFQGGFHLRAYESCGIAYYRAPCVNRCVFPKGGNIRGQCVPCTNAQTMHANYTSAGTELVSNAAPWYGTLNNCSFTCLNGYVRHGNQCVAS